MNQCLEVNIVFVKEVNKFITRFSKVFYDTCLLKSLEDMKGWSATETKTGALKQETIIRSSSFIIGIFYFILTEVPELTV